MCVKEWQKILLDDKYKEQWVHEDPPNYFYGEHYHPVDTVHVVIGGMMIVWMNGEAHKIREGQRLDIEKHTPHSAKIGPDGCRFLMGVRI